MIATRKKISTRSMAITAMLGAISAVLGMTPLGFIPVGATNATIMHIPVIIGAVLEGPVVGLMVGIIFGVFSLIRSITTPTPISFVFWNPMVSVVPRILIGIVSYYVYVFILKKVKNEAIAFGGAGLLGTLTNTVGVLGMIYLMYGAKFASAIGQDPATAGKVIFGIGLANGIPEMLLATVIVMLVGKSLRAIKR